MSGNADQGANTKPTSLGSGTGSYDMQGTQTSHPMAGSSTPTTGANPTAGGSTPTLGAVTTTKPLPA